MAKKQNDTTPVKEQIITIDFNDEMQTSYVDYAMSVIVARALPDIRDGLKPVQRRILYAMKELGLRSDGPFKKSARIVGDTMGKYHPHGDSSIYEAMVNLSKDWAMNHPLVDGHGNFGSIEGDGAAAMRYTEARLSKLAEEVFLKDLEKQVIDFIPNFDESEQEPSVLPVKIPNILVSGAEGIAVGMACKIPSHNLGEIIDATDALISNPNIDTEGLMEYVKGPDFATGGMIANADALKEIYETGVGKLRIRGKVEVEEGKFGKTNLVVTEIPFTMIGAIDKFMGDVADLVRNKVTSDIVDIRNISDKDGLRIVIELKKGANVQRNIDLLYKKAKLEDTFGVNMLAVDRQKPVQMSLKMALQSFVTYQLELYERKYKYLLAKELEKKEIKEGLIRAVDCIDLIIEILRGSKSIKDAKECLMYGKTEAIQFRYKGSEMDARQLSFTERQATAILEMRLQKLIGLEIEALKKEYDEAVQNCKTYEGLLASPAKMRKKLQSDLRDIKKTFAIPRKTEITIANEIVIQKEEIKAQDYYILIDRFRYVKAIDEATYQRNEEAAGQEFKYVIRIQNLDKLCVFTDTGKVHQIKVLDIPLGKFRDKGVPIENISNCGGNEAIVFIEAFSKLEEEMLLFVTSKGMVKQVKGSEFMVSKRTIDATKLGDDARVAGIFIAAEESDIVLGTKQGYYIRFKALEVSEYKKTAVGVRGIKLKEDDEVVLCAIGDSKSEFEYEEKMIPFTRIKATKRDGQGTKLRL